jgi:hypothetical protein
MLYYLVILHTVTWLHDTGLGTLEQDMHVCPAPNNKTEKHNTQ